MKINELAPKTAFLAFEFLFMISCWAFQEIDSELDLSLVTPYEIKPTCSNCSNVNMTLFSDSFLQYNQDTSLKNLISKTDNDNQDASTFESIDIESDFANSTIESFVKVEPSLSLINFTNVNISINTSVISNNNLFEQVSTNVSLNISQTQLNLVTNKLNTTNSSIILVTLKSTEMTITQKIKNEITSPDVESNGILLSNIF